jgi:hypothetical protein
MTGYAVTATGSLGVQTVSLRTYGSGYVADEAVSAGVTNRTTRHLNGATVTEKLWRDAVSGASLSMRTRTETSWDAGGCETENGRWTQ